MVCLSRLGHWPGLKAIAPLFKELDQLLRAKLRSESHWHADETRWAVFVTTEGKVGHRWYLWAFQSPSVVHYVIDPTRATKVIEGELAGVQSGIISCDRYSAYKRFARLNPGVLLAFAGRTRDVISSNWATHIPACCRGQWTGCRRLESCIT